MCLHRLFPNTNKAQNSRNPLPASSLGSPQVAVPLCARTHTKHAGRNTGAEMSANTSLQESCVSWKTPELAQPSLTRTRDVKGVAEVVQPPGGRIMTKVQRGMKSPSLRACSTPTSFKGRLWLCCPHVPKLRKGWVKADPTVRCSSQSQAAPLRDAQRNARS